VPLTTCDACPMPAESVQAFVGLSGHAAGGTNVVVTPVRAGPRH
jgi:hypothetical protein